MRKMIGTVTIVAATLTASGAMAQTSPAPDRPQADRKDGDIVVTARRRDEKLSDVPLAASAINAAQLEQRPLEKIEDFLRQTPSASIVFAGPDYLKDVSIRGQGGGRNGFSDSATGLYRNGIYVAGGGFGGRSFNALDLYDARSFEVYRGPQGALFGRNAVGGAVNIITQQPKVGTSATAEIGYDDRDRFNQNATINLGLGDVAAIRIGEIYYDQNGGFIRDLRTGATLDRTDFVGVRAAAKLMNLGGFSLTGTYEYSKTNAPGFSILGARTLVTARPTAVIDPDLNFRNDSRYGYVAIGEDAAFANLDGSLGFADLAAVFTYKVRNGARTNEDLDHFLGFEGIGASDLTVSQTERFERTGAEIRLTSKAGAKVAWLLGVDWQHYTDTVSTINDGTTTVATLRELATRSDFSTERSTSYSAFGNIEIPLLSSVFLSAEGRVQRDEKSFQFQRIDRVPTPTNSSIAPINLDQSETRFSPGATLKWKFAHNAQTYFRFASAYRPAGFNIGTGVLTSIPYQAEVARGVELGLKLPVFRGLRASLAAYYQHLANAQIVTTVSATDTTAVLQNIPEANYTGLELELNGNWRLGPGRFTIDASAATQGGNFGDGSKVIVNGVTYDVSNQRANRVRDFIGSFTATYDVQLGNRWSGFLTVSATGESGGFENAVGALNVAGVSRPLADYALVHAKLGIRGGPLIMSVFVNNIGDRRYITQNVQGNNYFNEGRVVGVSLRARFGN